jgi:Flp pilus assembly pilin Flp
MSSVVLEQYVRAQAAASQFAQAVRDRMREQAGQTTVEWLVIMVGLVALAGVLAGSGIWTDVANALGDAFTTLINNVKDASGG